MMSVSFRLCNQMVNVRWLNGKHLFRRCHEELFIFIQCRRQKVRYLHQNQTTSFSVSILLLGLSIHTGMGASAHSTRKLNESSWLSVYGLDSRTTELTVINQLQRIGAARPASLSNSNLSLQYFCDESKHDSDKTEYFQHNLRVS